MAARTDATHAEGVASRVHRLRERRLGEDERLVCMARARILAATREKYAGLSRAMRQAAIVRDLCEQIPVVIQPEDLIAGRMPEIVPTADEEAFIADRPELFDEPGVPGWLDSMSIYVPDWHWLIREGLGGIAEHARARLAAMPADDDQAEERSEFLRAAVEALESVSSLIRRYAGEARRLAPIEACAVRRTELQEIADRCDRIAWDAPATFTDALQLIQLVHMVLSCLVGGRDVTPGRIDQYLIDVYRRDTGEGTLAREDAAALLAMFLLRLSQMAGNATDYDDNLRRSPCKYTHLYVTVGGVDIEGSSAVNELSFALLDAVELLRYKEPTLLVRYHEGIDRAFMARVAELIADRLPITVYNDEVVVPALHRHGVPVEHARDYSHSACHNVTIAGLEAGTGVGGFHNLPRLITLAMNGGRDLATGEQAGAPTPSAAEIKTFEDLWAAVREQVRSALANARRQWEQRWADEFADACPILQSCLMRDSLDQARPCWQAARISHFNHYLMGLGTAVDSQLAIRRLVFEAEGKRMQLGELVSLMARNWQGAEALRQRIPSRLPRWGQDDEETREMAARLGRLWVEEVERASQGMTRFQMWPGFYSHMAHVHDGARTGATPDGRMAGEPLSANVSPSFGSPRCSPTSILSSMTVLPFDHTPSGAALLSLDGSTDAERLLALMEAHFRAGGLHLQINTVDVATLRAAMRAPKEHRDLMVRVAGFSAQFVRLSRQVQEDVVRRHGG